MVRVVDVKPREGFQIWLRFNDGTMGSVVLNDLADRGVFKIWADRRVFESVRVTDAGAVEWPGDVDLCADALYLRLTGKHPEDLFPALRTVRSDA
ncbi:MAG: DUF2442 domain-containing protein [Sulfobacillus benefaciens]|uniref:DUF2442 domain-containing protein n=1 Tax=Sulfobacillus benefaciens TaxID=453960 RepID=A0A2T2WU40_9FIRM|nr:MAG: DUF2442 domain-containing protein [Sulfobacillus benefaciens]